MDAWGRRQGHASIPLLTGRSRKAHSSHDSLWNGAGSGGWQHVLFPRHLRGGSKTRTAARPAAGWDPLAKAHPRRNAGPLYGTRLSWGPEISKQRLSRDHPRDHVAACGTYVQAAIRAADGAYYLGCPNESECAHEPTCPGGNEEPSMLLNTFCVLEVACCTPRTTVLEAAHLMRRHHMGDLVVVEDEETKQSPLGIITDRDIV